MKNLKLCTAFIALASCCTIISCDEGLFSKCRRDDYSFIAENGFSFGILDKNTKENILAYGQITYNYDTLQLYDENWNAVLIEPVPGNGIIDMRFLKEEDKGVINQLTNRRFYMYFNYQDVDTIDIAFEAQKNKCKEQILKSLKVSYNDSIYLDGPIEKYYAYFLK